MTREAIRFWRHGQPVEISGFHPRTTLLDYLRLDQRHFGTKEGCAEGDCGACTVALGRLRDGARASTSRSTPASCCSARSTARRSSPSRISPSDGALHPVQAAMVAHHGSQCGFCTPGIVMSLFALYQDGARPVSREAVNDCARRQSLPLHRLPADRRRGAATPAPRRAGRRLRARPPTLRGRCSPRSPTARMSSSATPTRFFAAPASEDVARRALRRASRRRPSSPARPMSGCGSPRACCRSTRSSGSAASRACDAIEEDGGRARHRRDGEPTRDAYRRARGASIPISANSCAASARRRCAPPARSAATSPTARRSATSPPALIALGADAGTAQGGAVRARCRSRISSSPTASRTASPASSSRRSSCRGSRPDEHVPRLQGRQALRRGHLGRDGRLPHHARRATSSPRRASPSAAWPATPKRAPAAEAALVGASRWTTRRPGATASPALAAGLHAARRPSRARAAYRIARWRATCSSRRWPRSPATPRTRTPHRRPARRA